MIVGAKLLPLPVCGRGARAHAAPSDVVCTVRAVFRAGGDACAPSPLLPPVPDRREVLLSGVETATCIPGIYLQGGIARVGVGATRRERHR